MAYDYSYESDYVDIDAHYEEVNRLQNIISDRDEEIKDCEFDIRFYGDLIFEMMNLLEKYSDDKAVQKFMKDHTYSLYPIKKERS